MSQDLQLKDGWDRFKNVDSYSLLGLSTHKHENVIQLSSLNPKARKPKPKTLNPVPRLRRRTRHLTLLSAPREPERGNKAVYYVVYTILYTMYGMVYTIHYLLLYVTFYDLLLHHILYRA